MYICSSSPDRPPLQYVLHPSRVLAQAGGQTHCLSKESPHPLSGDTIALVESFDPHVIP